MSLGEFVCLIFCLSGEVCVIFVCLFNNEPCITFAVFGSWNLEDF